MAKVSNGCRQLQLLFPNEVGNKLSYHIWPTRRIAILFWNQCSGKLAVVKNKSVQTTMHLKWAFWDSLGHFGTIRMTF